MLNRLARLFVKRSRSSRRSTPRRSANRSRSPMAAADNWTFLETLSPETDDSASDRLLACFEHLQTASDHAVAPGWFEKYREILRQRSP